MHEKPRVSVILPVYNMAQYVAEAIDSVLGQTYGNVELICIDDGSTDNSMEVLRSFGDRIRVFQNDRNYGIAKGRNVGIAAATGAFISFMDADDIWHPQKLQRQMDRFIEDPDLALCFAYMESFISPELPEEIKRMRYCPPEPTPGYIGGTALIKKEVFERVGLLDETLRVGEFIDWNTRAKDMGFKSLMLPDVLYRRRIHATNTGVNDRPFRGDYLKVVRSAIARRKQS